MIEQVHYFGITRRPREIRKPREDHHTYFGKPLGHSYKRVYKMKTLGHRDYNIDQTRRTRRKINFLYTGI